MNMEEIRQDKIKCRMKLLAEAGYAQPWTSGIVNMAEVIDACYLVARDMVSDADSGLTVMADGDEEPEWVIQLTIAYTQMLFSRMQFLQAPQPQSEQGVKLLPGQKLVRGVPFPDLKGFSKN